MICPHCNGPLTRIGASSLARCTRCGKVFYRDFGEGVRLGLSTFSPSEHHLMHKFNDLESERSVIKRTKGQVNTTFARPFADA